MSPTLTSRKWKINLLARGGVGPRAGHLQPTSRRKHRHARRTSLKPVVNRNMLLSMKRRRYLSILLVLILASISGGLFAQRRDFQRNRTSSPGGPNQSGMRNQRSSDDRSGVPEWTVNEQFRKDIFTFVRLEYRSYGRGGWRNDFPGADLNFSYRLEQLTSMKVDPEALHIPITDPRLREYPFVFMNDPRSIELSSDEADALRKYLLNGGFLMIDDLWGNRMLSHVLSQFKKVFPDRQPISLKLSHPIFHTPYPLKEIPQVPSEDSAHRNKDASGLYRTWEDEISYEDPQPADYKAFLDDKGRIVMIICWNTDLSDGWEEENISPWFFTTYSETLAYPMGINIIFHALTH